MLPKSLQLVPDHELLGHANLSTATIYVHVLSKGGQGVSSSLDWMEAP